MALTAEERQWAYEQLQNLIDSEELDYVDNYRVAEVGDSAEEAEYERIRDEGCCGSVNQVYTHPTTGKQILVGCNWGH